MPCTPGCGSCCDPITLAPDVAALIFDPDPAVRAQLGPGDDRLVELWAPLDLDPLGRVRLACVEYDREARACSDWPNRPPICRGYPFYDEPPAAAVLDRRPASLVCGYQEDAGRTRLPLTVLRG